MILTETLELPTGTLELGLAEPGDLEAVLNVFDEAVAGMNARGNLKQWGTEPFSKIPRLVDRFIHHLRDDRVIFGAKQGRIVGVIVVNFAVPSYCWQGTEEQAAYIQPFATSPQVRGGSIGRILLERAEVYAREMGMSLLRLDCFAENPGLPAYYEAAGFEPRGDFSVGEWHGRMFEKSLV